MIRRSFFFLFITLIYATSSNLCAKIKTEGRFLDVASDYPITVAYVYDGCHHQASDYCHNRKLVYNQNKKTLWNVSTNNALRAASVHFMAIDASRNRIKNVKQFLSITEPDTFIVFINGYVANYDYLTGAPTQQQLIEYIKKSAGEKLNECQSGACAKTRCPYSVCNPPERSYGSPSWATPGYYGVMGGPPPNSFGIIHAGAYSYSMGFRRLPN